MKHFLLCLEFSSFKFKYFIMIDFEEFSDTFNELPEEKQEYLYFSAKFQLIAWIVMLGGFIIAMSTI